mgnify:CR=1 FL=1|tara:strand:+ start:2709 stop:3050 length:342 start_codon:yes stop_codon:yes gene_type:complete
MKKNILLATLFVISGCQVSNLVNFNPSKLTPEYACILNATYAENNEKVPSDITKYLEVENIKCDGSAVKEEDEEPKLEIVTIIKPSQTEEKTQESNDEDEDEDFFLIKRPRIK